MSAGRSYIDGAVAWPVHRVEAHVAEVAVEVFRHIEADVDQTASNASLHAQSARIMFRLISALLLTVTNTIDGRLVYGTTRWRQILVDAYLDYCAEQSESGCNLAFGWDPRDSFSVPEGNRFDHPLTPNVRYPNKSREISP